MIEQLFNDLTSKLEVLSKELSDQLSSKGFEINSESDDNTIKIVIKKKDNSELKKIVEDFRKYVDAMEDNIFDETCIQFNEESNISLNEFDKVLKEATNEVLIKDTIALWKELAKESVQNYIEELKNKYKV